jgi:hypothetical protein
MTSPLNKHKLLADINNNFRKLGLELDTLPPVLFNDPAIRSHADGVLITACELIAHAIGWTELALKWLNRQQAGGPLAQPETDYSRDEFDRLSLSFYGGHNTLSFKELRTRFTDSNGRLVERINEIDNANLFDPSSHESLTVGELIHRYISSLYEKDHFRIRVWKQGLGWV